MVLSGSLWLSAAFSASTDFRAVLRAWSGNVEDGNIHSGSVSGPVLFQSAVTTALNGGPTRFDFALPSVALQAGASYVFFAEAVQGNLFGYTTSLSNVYAGGNGVYGQTPDPEGEMFYDASFVATFATTVPEPASIFLLATGLVGVLGVVRRRST